jgi:hypothetical protein
MNACADLLGERGRVYRRRLRGQLARKDQRVAARRVRRNHPDANRRAVRVEFVERPCERDRLLQHAHAVQHARLDTHARLPAVRGGVKRAPHGRAVQPLAELGCQVRLRAAHARKARGWGRGWRRRGRGRLGDGRWRRNARRVARRRRRDGSLRGLDRFRRRSTHRAHSRPSHKRRANQNQRQHAKQRVCQRLRLGGLRLWLRHRRRGRNLRRAHRPQIVQLRVVMHIRRR